MPTSSHARVATSSQDTLDALQIDLSLLCDVLSTNAGAIFELTIFGYTTLIILRPSIGSYAFHNSTNQRDLTLLLRSLYWVPYLKGWFRPSVI